MFYPHREEEEKEVVVVVVDGKAGKSIRRGKRIEKKTVKSERLYLNRK